MVRVAIASQFRWQLWAQQPAARDRLVRELSLHPIVAQALVNRKVETPEAARSHLAPSLAELPDPSRLPDFTAALAACDRAFASGSPILIHGDYDVDGTCGAALLFHLLRLLGREAQVFVPDRIRDGYSFSDASLDAIARGGARLVFAVDNGTTAFAPLEQLAARGVDVVVLDHHPPAARTPACAALLNPWRAAADDLFPHFCGTAVAWLFAWGLLRHRHGAGALPESARRFLFDALGLVAVATVADVMPLRGPNRALVARGLEALRDSGFPGLAELVRSCGVRGQPSAGDLGFRVAPRLNAAGRMGRAELAFQLLSTAEPPAARAWAAELDALNLVRREVEQDELRALESQIEEQQRQGDRLIFAGRPEARFGVLGVVANRVLDATGLPTLLWAECGPGLARGSARAPDGSDLTALLAGAREWLIGFGGHARAAGFHFDPRHAGAIHAALRAAAAKLPAPPPATLWVDHQVAPGELSPSVVAAMNSLQPFGEQHPEPRFLGAGMQVASVRPLGDGSHLELRLEAAGEVVRALAWRMAERLTPLASGSTVDVVFSAAINEFRGRRQVEWTIADLRTSG